MANTKSSPNKFISALFGGKQRRREQRAANEDFGNQMDAWEDRKMTNPYAGIKNPYADMENVYEDQTVNLKQAEFEREQAQQSMSNILLLYLVKHHLKVVSIGQQEQANQTRAMAEAGRLQQLEVEGEQKRDLMEREGRRMVEQFEFDKQDKMLGWAMDRKAAADQAIDNANAQLDRFVSGAVTAGVSGGLSLLGDK
mgnify:CR=1 FL=1